MAETLTIRTATSTEVVKIAVPGPQGPAGPKGDPGDVAGLPLSTQGDTLYRGSAANERLAIGTAGQVLKVSSGGIPEWGAESGAVSSVAGRTGAVVLAVADVANAVATSDARLSDARTPTSHTHTLSAITDAGTAAAVDADQDLNTTSNVTFGVVNVDSELVAAAIKTGGQIQVEDNNNYLATLTTGSDILSANRNYQLPDASGTIALTTTAPASHAHGALTNDGKVGTTANLPLKTGTNGVVEAGSFSNAAGTFCEGNDARLSDDRDPNLHAASHLPDGADEIFDQSLNTTSAVTFNSIDVGSLTATSLEGLDAIVLKDNLLNEAIITAGEDVLTDNQSYQLPNASGTLALTSDIPTTASEIGAAASGSITSSGLTQATARILGRTTASTGSVEEITIGSGLSLSAGELSATGGSGGGEVRSDFVSPYTYTGLADAGTSESTASWLIRRSEFDAGGSFVATLTASAVQWANRLTASYA
jgi:hypothetical protein